MSVLEWNGHGFNYCEASRDLLGLKRKVMTIPGPKSCSQNVREHAQAKKL